MSSVSSAAGRRPAASDHCWLILVIVAVAQLMVVLDATVGRNALAQENIFGNAIGVTGIVMTKLDGTARGGVLVPVAQASDSPIKLIGVGEGVEDLQAFDARAFSRSLVGLEGPFHG